MSSKKKKSPEELARQAPAEEISEAWNRTGRNAIADRERSEQSPESAMQAPLVMMMSQEESRNWHPGPIDPDKVMADEYDKCGSSIPLLLRAILRELVISRCTHEH